MTSRRAFTAGLCGCAAMIPLAAGSVSAQTAREFVAPGYRPAPDTDERGLWSMIDRAERELAASRFVVKDEKVSRYVGGIVCRLAASHCADVRPYVVRTPQFNASMAPNGMMQVWTGVLLRCHDEAQLAAVIGHELGHYLRRHSLQRFRDARAKMDVAAFLGLGLAAAGLGLVGAATNLALIASVLAYSRDQEREADEIGHELLASAGYAPVAAAEVWEQLIDEMSASTADRRDDVFLSTHPEPSERLAALRAAADGHSGERFRERHVESLASVRNALLVDEIRLRQYGRSEKILDRMLALDERDAPVWFAKGEIARLRAEPGDVERAREAYLKAIQTGRAAPDVYRALGQVELSAGRRDDAVRWFERYFEAAPDAPDREPIRALLR